MITYIKGDMFQSPAQVLVNTVNTVGVMGKGVALEFKKRYPAMFHRYQTLCENGQLTVGKLYLWKGPDKWVLLFPTKKHWRNPSKIEYVEQGLNKFASTAVDLGIESIAFPKLGCGNGSLNWNDVQPLMERYLKDLPIRVYIYVENIPSQAVEHETPTEMEKWLRSDLHSLGFTTIKEDLQKALRSDEGLRFTDGTIKHIYWEDDRLVLQNGHKIVIPEQELCSFWDYIRSNGIVSFSSIPLQYKEYAIPMLAILSKLDYLQPIVISNSGKAFELKTNGYQCIYR